MNAEQADWFTTTRTGFTDWLIDAVNATLQFLAQVAVLIWQDPPRAAIVAGGLILTLAIYGGVRARLRRRSKGLINDENKRGLRVNDVVQVAMYNRRLKR